jgi:5-methylcytosine-specific restriction endonuclease McrA
MANLKTMDQAKQHAVLWFAEIQKRRLYRELGYPSMTMYARQALGFSSSRASDFARLAAKLDELPQLRGELEAGAIGYTKANQVAAVSNKENEGQWLAEARNCSRNELGKKIKQARRKAKAARKGQGELPIPEAGKPGAPAAVVPVRLTTEFSPEQFARYEALLEKISKQSGRNGQRLPVNRAEAMLELLGSYLEQMESAVQTDERRTKESRPSRRRESGRPAARRSTGGPTFQIHLHRCPDCSRSTVQTSRGEVPLSQATARRAACDARIAQPGQRNTTTIPPRTRREVLSRDRHRCRRPGCANTRFLEVHHLVPRQEGGSNEPENLITLCAACHQLLHEKKWAPANLVRERPPRYGPGLELPVRA